MSSFSRFTGLVVSTSLALLTACGDRGGSEFSLGESHDQPGNTFGRLTVNLVDAPREDVTGVFVTIAKVTAETANGSLEISSAPTTVDLLSLQNGSFLTLGELSLPEGEIDALRLMLSDSGPQYVQLQDGTQPALKVPSGMQSGIKIPGPFHVRACEAQTVTLDFDADKSVSVHKAGKSEQWILRPVVFVKQIEANAIDCAPAADGGTSGDGGSVSEPDTTDAGAPGAGDADGGTVLG